MEETNLALRIPVPTSAAPARLRSDSVGVDADGQELLQLGAGDLG